MFTDGRTDLLTCIKTAKEQAADALKTGRDRQKQAKAADQVKTAQQNS